MEFENIYEAEILPHPKQSEIDALLDKLESGDYYLSFSSISAFMVSPYNFVKYKIKEDKDTDATLRGSVFHAHVLEPDTIAEKYIRMPDVPFKTVEDKKIISDWAEPLIGIEFPINKQSNKILPKKEKLCEMVFEKTGKKPVSAKIAEQAKDAAKVLLKNEASSHILSRVTETERKFETEIEGVKFRGSIDGKGNAVPRMIVDLKLVPSANREKVGGVIYGRNLTWQLAGYNFALGRDYECYLVMADQQGEVCCTRLSATTLQRAERQLRQAIVLFKDCIARGILEGRHVWEQSQDYWFKSELNRYGMNVI